jgi:two-component system nitrate/nitrite response regulator NarL
MVTALRAGATSFLPKTGSAEKLVPPLKAIHDGWTIVPPPVLAALLASTEEDEAPDPVLSNLTVEEGEVWQMITHGLTDEQIAERKACSDRTAKRFVHKLLKERLGGLSRVQAAARGGQIGLLDVPLGTDSVTKS